MSVSVDIAMRSLLSERALTGRTNAPPIYDVGEEACVRLPNTLIEGEPYPLPALGVVLSGFLDYRANTGAATAVPGTVLLGNPGEEFSYRNRDSSGNKRLVVIFNEHFLRDVARDCGLEDSRFHTVALPPGGISAMIFGRIRRLALQNDDGEEAAYMLAACALQAGRTDSKALSVPAKNLHRIPSVVRYIEESYSTACSLKMLAEMACLSPFHFIRVFKEATGQSPNQYVINTRLRAAADLLLATKHSISEVAFAVGFKDISHFNACFRTLFGCAPRQWRRGT